MLEMTLLGYTEEELTEKCSLIRLIFFSRPILLQKRKRQEEKEEHLIFIFVRDGVNTERTII